MKQETLEEAATNYANKELSNELTSKVGNFYGFSSSFIEGAKWQQEKLCDSEVIQRIRASKSDAEARRIIRTI